MKTLTKLVYIIVLGHLSVSASAMVQVMPRGQQATLEEAAVYQRDYNQLMEQVIREFFTNGKVSDSTYKAVSLLVQAAEVRGYVFSPSLRVTDQQLLAQAAFVQLMESPALKLDYQNIYKLNLKRSRP